MVNKERLSEEAPIDDEPQLDQDTIDRAIAVMETAEQLGIPLTSNDIALHFGLTATTRRQRLGEGIRRHAPDSLKESNRFLTASEKVGRVAAAICEDNLLERPLANERFEQDRLFWDRMQIRDAWEARLFDNVYFSHTTLDFTEQKQPIQIEWLEAASASAFTALSDMQAAGHNFRFSEIKETPFAVLDSASNIADRTQKTFLSTWLSPFLLEGKEPIVTEEEREAYDYEKDLEVIDAFRQRALRITTQDQLTDKEQGILDDANQLLSVGLSGEYLREYLIHDHSARQSEALRQMLPMLIGLSFGAWGIEKYAPNDIIKALAKIAGSGDDITTEFMSLPRLQLSKEELRRRLTWLIPFTIGVMATDAMVDKVDKSVDPHIGGAMYGTSTVALSAVSSGSSLKKHSSRYKELVAEGKVRDEHITKPSVAAREHYIGNDPLRQGIVRGTVAGPVISTAVWPWIEHKPYIYVPLGAIEPISAAANIKYDEFQLSRRLKKYTRKQITMLKS